MPQRHTAKTLIAPMTLLIALVGSILGCGVVDMVVADVEWALGTEESSTTATPSAPSLPAPYEIFSPLLTRAQSHSIKGDCLFLYFEENLLVGQTYYSTSEMFELVEQEVFEVERFVRSKDGSAKGDEASKVYENGSRRWTMRTSRMRGRNTVSLTSSSDAMCETVPSP